MIYVPSFVEIGSDLRKVTGEDWQTHRHHGDRTSLLAYFRLKINF
jgi:hypothetical protein